MTQERDKKRYAPGKWVRVWLTKCQVCGYSSEGKIHCILDVFSGYLSTKGLHRSVFLSPYPPLRGDLPPEKGKNNSLNRYLIIGTGSLKQLRNPGKHWLNPKKSISLVREICSSLLLILVFTPWFGYLAFCQMLLYVLSPLITWRIDPQTMANRPQKDK